MEKIKCVYCGKEYTKKGIGTHIWRVHGKGKEHDPNKKRVAWNKGLSKESDLRVKSYGNSISRSISGESNPFYGHEHSCDTKNRIGEKLSINNKGGRCKWYDVRKVDGSITKVQGTWEKRFAEVLNFIDEEWIKPSLSDKRHSFKWIDDNEIEHTYTPDFYSPKFDKYFEVKGYWWGEDKNKMKNVLEQNEVKIEMIFKKELDMYEKLGR